LKTEFAGRCEFAYVEGVDRTVWAKYDVNVLPAVLCVPRRQERSPGLVNLIKADELRKTLAGVTGDDQVGKKGAEAG